MSSSRRFVRPLRRRVILVPAFAGLLSLTAQAPAFAGPTDHHHGTGLVPGDLVVSTSVYRDDPNIIAGETALPPGCVNPSPKSASCVVAVTGGSYPYVFNNDSVDGSFGVTSKIVLDELSPSGAPDGWITVPNSGGRGVSAGDDQMVTSFSSKSELAMNLSTSGQYLTFMGYNAPVDTVDVSNSNTPGAYDPTNPVIFPYYRVLAELGKDGQFHFTETNAYSGNNGRAAILNDKSGADVVYAAGNAGNGANPEPAGVVLGAGAQLISPSPQPEAQQSPGQPTPVGSFNAPIELGAASQKIAKDNNYRGIAVYDNVLYYTKGSGSNGVDTVYFVDTTGKACPGGVGLPQPGASLPTTSALSYNASEGGTGNPGLTPQNMCILKGFPATPAASATDSSDYPFGLWFANPDTLYVADEGSGDNAYSATAGDYSAAAASATAGLQKWVYNTTAGEWQLAYTLQSGLALGTPYTVAGYPTGDNSGPGGSGLPWAPATDGLRTLTGRVNSNGTVTIWAVTSTVSGSGDQGADPDKLVKITDNLHASAAPAGESFTTLDTASAGTVLRGVSFTPGTPG